MRPSLGFSATLLAAAAILATYLPVGGSYSSFTAVSVNPGNLVGTATLTMSNSKPNAADLMNVSGLVPGDTAARSVTITNTGNVGFTYVAAAGATASTLLWTDTTNGVQVTVARGSTTLYTGPIKTLVLPTSPTIAAGATDTLTYSFTFPATAGNTFQGLSQDFTITYTATQLPGGAR